MERENTLLKRMAEIVREAGCLAREKALSKSVHVKGSADFVTDADLAVSEFLADRLPSLIEGSRVLSEEDAEKTGMDGRVFVIDPIDGTTNLMYGLNMSAVSCGYCEDGVAMLAAIYQPFTDELFTARRGGGAWCNGRPIRVHTGSTLSEALVGIETGPATRDRQEAYFRAMHSLQTKCNGLRLTGSAALDFCLVASGRLTGVVCHYLFPWDYAAGWLLVEEAGGRLSLVSGGKPSLIGRSEPIAASNGLIHDELCTLFRDT